MLKGARQVGKTYILKEFGKGEYANVAYFNFEEDPDLNEIFTGRLSPETIPAVLNLSPEAFEKEAKFGLAVKSGRGS